MKFSRYPQNTPLKKASVITIGNFDGVHVGHQALIKQVTEYALTHKLQSVVVTMDPLAAQYFAGRENVALLTPFKCKYKLLKKLAIDVLCMLNFNHKLAEYTPEDFIQKILIDGLQAKHIIIGDDFRFGKNRAGDIKTLKSYCENFGITISHIDSVICNNERVASSKIRKHIINSDFKTVTANLGRHYSIAGKVSKGQQLGRELGYPTINIKLKNRKESVNGIYCVKVLFENNKKYIGAASIGTRPTVNGVEKLLEVHLLGFNKQVYGQNVEVLFYHKIRNEVKFENLTELKQYIKDDVIKTRQFFKETNSEH